jgi:hypothetical protein
MDKFYSLGETARLLKVAPYKITYGHAIGKLREPLRLLGKRAYRQSDLKALAEYFDVELLEPARKGLGKETDA